MVILAIDPGTEQSAVVRWDGELILDHDILANELVLHFIQSKPFDLCATEGLSSYGMPVGKETFVTAYWIGRFWQTCLDCCGNWRLIYRTEVKLYLCHSVRAKDGNVRQALLDKVGPSGSKADPGPTYGIHTHEWSALAIAVYAHSTFSR